MKFKEYISQLIINVKPGEMRQRNLGITGDDFISNGDKIMNVGERSPETAILEFG